MNERIVWPDTGRYLLAVSGGADSMVLLDVFANANRPYELAVAHFNHGMRPESADDARFVAAASRRYGLEFYTEAGELGAASEAQARAARHAFFERARVANGARAVITAHHQDDLIETSLLNVARGTNRRGLAPMQDAKILRPFIALRRVELREYATAHQIQWREDATNGDTTNPRNFLRLNLLTLGDGAWRREYVELIQAAAEVSARIGTLVEQHFATSGAGTITVDRVTVRDLSLTELQEVIATAAHRLEPAVELGERVLQEAALFAKTGRPGTMRPLRAMLCVTINRDYVAIIN